MREVCCEGASRAVAAHRRIPGTASKTTWFVARGIYPYESNTQHLYAASGATSKLYSLLQIYCSVRPTRLRRVPAAPASSLRPMPLSGLRAGFANRGDRRRIGMALRLDRDVLLTELLVIL